MKATTKQNSKKYEGDKCYVTEEELSDLLGRQKLHANRLLLMALRERELRLRHRLQSLQHLNFHIRRHHFRVF